MVKKIGQKLEQYTINRPQEVLLVRLESNGESDEVAIFKGFSSSLMHPTAFDPDVPVIPDQATIICIDRAKAPYNPKSPEYIQKGLSWDKFKQLLVEAGIEI